MNKHDPISKTQSAAKHTVAVFKSNRSQAIRIPKAIAFSDVVKKVEITVVEGGLLISPVRLGWDDYLARRKGLSADFPLEIEDSPAEPVEGFE